MSAAVRLQLFSSLLLVACTSAPQGDIRDVRPTTIELDDTIVVELDGPRLVMGARTWIRFDDLPEGKEAPILLEARTVASDRVVAEARNIQVPTWHRGGPTRVTVLQQLGARTLTLTTAPGETYDLQLFPPSSQGLANALHHGPLRSFGWLVDALVLLAIAAFIAMPVPVVAGLIVVWERKLSGYMQSRWGPNRVGPNGWLQWLADGIKLLLKEDIIPREADRILFRISPYLAFVGLFLTLLVLPISSRLCAVDLPIGVLYLLSVTSIVVVSILMGGWSSNSKWALLGGMRSAAQIISYEIPASLALLCVVVPAGSLSLQRIVAAQGGAPWTWNLFHDPFTFVAFFVYFISALAEGNRTPFDLPEAESELVAGFSTEYSGFRFSLYPMVEWVNLFVIGAIVSALFLGGWRLPFVTVQQMHDSFLWDAAGAFVFLVKDIAIIFVIIWIRWTLPRLRVDQMMALCWKYLVPPSLACLLGAVAYALWVPRQIGQFAAMALFALVGVGGALWFACRVRAHQLSYKDLVLNDKLGRGP